jgi:hypothetical protein
VTADFDGDGQLEIVTNNFNDQPYYFKTSSRARITSRSGARHPSNRDAIGAVVRLYREARS